LRDHRRIDAVGRLLFDRGVHVTLAAYVGWISFYLLWGAAALHPSMAELERAASDRDPRLTPLRLVMLTCASLIAPVMALLQVIDEGEDRFVVNVAAILLFALVVARMAGLVRQQERSVARERILSAAGADLVAATNRADICRAALGAARALAGGDVAARLCLAEGDRVLVAGGELAAAWPVTPATAAALLDRSGASGSQRACPRVLWWSCGSRRRRRPRSCCPSRSVARRTGCSPSQASSGSRERCRAAWPHWRPRSRSRSRARP
jgi:hypothetical protein